VLHQKAYRETSLILDVLTQDYGRIGVLAKGAKRPKSPFRGRLQPFVCNLLNWSGKGQLKTLTAVDTLTHINLQGTQLYCGMYLNELVVRLTQPDDQHEALFASYQSAVLNLMSELPVEVTLRVFEKQLLRQLGYGLLLDVEYHTGTPVEPNLWYQYIVSKGPVRSQVVNDEGLRIQGKALMALEGESFSEPDSLSQCKYLMRYILDVYLGHEPLNSRALFQTISTR
jgi:DNA repair protein RecO (recombination protein O)